MKKLLLMFLLLMQGVADLNAAIPKGGCTTPMTLDESTNNCVCNQKIGFVAGTAAGTCDCIKSAHKLGTQCVCTIGGKPVIGGTCCKKPLVENAAGDCVSISSSSFPTIPVLIASLSLVGIISLFFVGRAVIKRQEAQKALDNLKEVTGLSDVEIISYAKKTPFNTNDVISNFVKAVAEVEKGSPSVDRDTAVDLVKSYLQKSGDFSALDGGPEIASMSRDVKQYVKFATDNDLDPIAVTAYGVDQGISPQDITTEDIVGNYQSRVELADKLGLSPRDIIEYGKSIGKNTRFLMDKYDSYKNMIESQSNYSPETVEILVKEYFQKYQSGDIDTFFTSSVSDSMDISLDLMSLDSSLHSGVRISVAKDILNNYLDQVANGKSPTIYSGDSILIDHGLQKLLSSGELEGKDSLIFVKNGKSYELPLKPSGQLAGTIQEVPSGVAPEGSHSLRLEFDSSGKLMDSSAGGLDGVETMFNLVKNAGTESQPLDSIDIALIKSTFSRDEIKLAGKDSIMISYDSGKYEISIVEGKPSAIVIVTGEAAKRNNSINLDMSADGNITIPVDHAQALAQAVARAKEAFAKPRSGLSETAIIAELNHSNAELKANDSTLDSIIDSHNGWVTQDGVNGRFKYSNHDTEGNQLLEFEPEGDGNEMPKGTDPYELPDTFNMDAL